MCFFSSIQNFLKITPREKNIRCLRIATQPAFTCSKLRIETIEQRCEMFKVNNKASRTTPMASLSNFERWKSWKHKQLWGLGPDHGCLYEKEVYATLKSCRDFFPEGSPNWNAFFVFRQTLLVFLVDFPKYPEAAKREYVFLKYFCNFNDNHYFSPMAY